MKIIDSDHRQQSDDLLFFPEGTTKLSLLHWIGSIRMVCKHMEVMSVNHNLK